MAEKAERTMYQAVCNTCGIDIRVPFQPTPEKPVFCKEHLADQRRGGPRPEKQPKKLNLSEDTDGTVLVKFFFQAYSDMPEGIDRRDDGQAFKMVGGRRQDTGTSVIASSEVSAEFIRTGLGNADGHQWKLVNVCWWEQPVTNPRAREEYGDTQKVLQLAYRSNPKDGALYLSRRVLAAIMDLVHVNSWRANVWQNDNGPATINFTSPADDEPRFALVVDQGCLVLADLEVIEEEQAKA